jgi:hypothetical protein
MVKNVFNTEMSFKVSHIDFEKRLCTVSIKYADKDFKFSRVPMSGLLAYAFKENKEHYIVDQWYTCCIGDPEWRNNPMQFIIYGESTKPKYLLDCVHVRKSKEIKITDPIGNTIVDYENRWHDKKHYRRYRNVIKTT